MTMSLARADEPIGVDPCLSDPTCKASYDSARSLSVANQYEGALVEYQKAYARAPTPWLIINIGRMQQRLHRYETAIDSFNKYLAIEGQDPELRAKVEGYKSDVLLQIEEEKKRALAGLPPLPPPAPPPLEKKPLYKRWSFWVAVAGGAAVVGTAVGMGLWAYSRPPSTVGASELRPF